MKVRRSEVVLVDFPYSDHTGSKVRPALVVQADAWSSIPALRLTAQASAARLLARRLQACVRHDLWW